MREWGGLVRVARPPMRLDGLHDGLPQEPDVPPYRREASFGALADHSPFEPRKSTPHLHQHVAGEPARAHDSRAAPPRDHNRTPGRWLCPPEPHQVPPGEPRSLP